MSFPPNVPTPYSDAVDAIHRKILSPDSEFIPISHLVGDCWNLPESQVFLSYSDSPSKKYMIALAIGNALKAYVDNDFKDRIQKDAQQS